MGDLDAKRLLVENSKLKIQQNELSSVLGEEREMVKYLHGVIKNYEQLLRSNSKSKSSPRPTVVKRYHTDLKTDPQLITKDHEEERDTEFESVSMKSQIITTQNRKGDSTGCLKPLSEQHRNKTPLSLQNCLMRGRREDSHRLSSYQGVNRPHICTENVSRSTDDLCLENLESDSSSDEDLVKDNRASFSAHNIEHNGILNPVQSSEGQPMGSVVDYNAPSRFDHEYNKESHSGKHQELNNPTLYPNRYRCSTTTYDEIDINREGTSSTNPTSSSTKTQPTSINGEKELAEMFRELDKMESKLNKCEKSVAKSEKRLTKIENKMEYLESFALGEESEWL